VRRRTVMVSDCGNSAVTPEGGPEDETVTYLIAKLHGGDRSEAQMFFAEVYPFPFAGASVTFMIAVNLAATLASLLGQG
jgi:hypothetical protein